MVQCILMGYAYSLKAHPPALWSCCVLTVGEWLGLWRCPIQDESEAGPILQHWAPYQTVMPVFSGRSLGEFSGWAGWSPWKEEPLVHEERERQSAPVSLPIPSCCRHSNVDGDLWKERGGEVFQTFVSIFFWIEWEIYTKILFAFWVLLILGSWRN